MAMLVITRVSLWTLPAESSTRLASQYHGGASPFVQSSSFSLGTVPWSNGQFIDIDQLIKRIPQNGALAPSLQIDFLPEVRRWNYMKVTTWHWTSGETSFNTESNRVWKNTTSALLFEHQDLLDFCRVLQDFCFKCFAKGPPLHIFHTTNRSSRGKHSKEEPHCTTHGIGDIGPGDRTGPGLPGQPLLAAAAEGAMSTTSWHSWQSCQSCQIAVSNGQIDTNVTQMESEKCKLQNVLQTQLRNTSCIVHSSHS